MESDTDIEFYQSVEHAKALERRVKEICPRIAELRRTYFGVSGDEKTKAALSALEDEAHTLVREHREAVKRLEDLSGIPPELLELLDKPAQICDEDDHIPRRTLVEDELPTTDRIEDGLSNSLDRIYRVVDNDWLESKRREGLHGLDEVFLREPLSLVRGSRISSEFPKQHRFAQAVLVSEDFLDGDPSVDFFAAALLVPQTVSLGVRLPWLRDVAGDTAARIAKLHKGPSEEVDSTVFELLVAGSCAHAGRSMEFLPERVQKTPDLRVHDYAFPTVVECKRKRSISDYEILEERWMRNVFDHLHDTASKHGLWGVFSLELRVALDEISPEQVAGALVRQRLAANPAKAVTYEWGSTAYGELAKRLEGPRTRVYSPLFLKQAFGWDTDLPPYDGLICKVATPSDITIEEVHEPIALRWTNSSAEALKKRAWGPVDIYGDATNQIPMGEVGVIYNCYQEGTREAIADKRVDNYAQRMREWSHSGGIRLPISVLVRLYPRPLGHGTPDLVESGVQFSSGLYGDQSWFEDFPTSVFTRLHGTE